MGTSIRLACLTLAILTLVGCKPNAEDTFVKKRSEATGAPVQTHKEIQSLLKTADTNEGLTQEEWDHLYELAHDPDPDVRMETITVMGGISAKKTKQFDQIVAFLEFLQKDSDKGVSEAAKGYLERYMEFRKEEK